ncbi:HK97-gp10 family putative phage morphogenesis protein [Natrinema sp. DC36]|uniref:HK97-gp10 family putative phage morphogenesis protein n=1 Tax=Natrinema sp. DC36 TaxID=2878680 RepID=UPI001CF04337|nr:HK97-gp10 family putative phage morphogenesis protein [Natrinema sp. DC36]
MELDFDFKSGFAPEDLDDSLGTLLEEGNDELEARVQEVALETEADARRRAAVDTGNLRASIEHEVESKRDSVKATVGTNTEYAPFVEFGTVHQEAQPFLRPAVDTTLRRYEPKVIEAVYKAVRSAQR